MARTFEANKLAIAFLNLIEKRDAIELRGRVPELVQHSFSLQMEMLERQREMQGGDQARNHSMSLASSVDFSEGQPELKEKFDKLQATITQEKRTNVDLSTKIVNLTKKISQMDTQLLEQDVIQTKLEKMTADLAKMTEVQAKMTTLEVR